MKDLVRPSVRSTGQRFLEASPAFASRVIGSANGAPMLMLQTIRAPQSPGLVAMRSPVVPRFERAKSRVRPQRSAIAGFIRRIHKTLGIDMDGLTAPPPMRDVDGWSDQAEVAFYEERPGRRA